MKDCKHRKPTERAIKSAEREGREDAARGFLGEIWNRYGCTHPELHAAWNRGNGGKAA